MDLQKEREAFECEFKQTDYYIAHGDLSTLMLCDDQYALDDVQVSFEMWQAAKAQAVPEGFVLVSAEQMSQWGHMANYAEQYGCPECFEARGYAHSLACEINEFFAIKAQDPAND
ncbi:hypothetical protein [Acinetobacter lwoffii]|uniref:hypothetical protein n=1 Tax=Acinetobacter lwoffii TaxID=28090 RepID=UPI00209A6C23|nr:hypothetical protein [Acinetobacter lwoffii]MCO8092681.1 hypothetical protein [Acinetobacter lwoffii]